MHVAVLKVSHTVCLCVLCVYLSFPAGLELLILTALDNHQVLSCISHICKGWQGPNWLTWNPFDPNSIQTTNTWFKWIHTFRQRGILGILGYILPCKQAYPIWRETGRNILWGPLYSCSFAGTHPVLGHSYSSAPHRWLSPTARAKFNKVNFPSLLQQQISTTT